jgi:hypothetical protein
MLVRQRGKVSPLLQAIQNAAGFFRRADNDDSNGNRPRLLAMSIPADDQTRHQYRHNRKRVAK